jgi:WD40 repeat protein
MPKSKHCIECGAALPDAAPGGLCSLCALRGALAWPGGEAEGGRLRARSGEPDGGKAGVSAVGTFGDYELLEKVAEGGMGVVYRARQLSLNRIVAVKMIQPGRVGSPEMVLRFRAEAEAAASLHHPNIVAIHETGECEGQHYFSMDYIEGQNLAEAVREGPLPSARAAQLVAKIAAAVDYAHQHGILHRDLKPSNVILDEAGEPRVTDFGLARRLGGDSTLTLTGQVFGSPRFMPPEQASGRRGAVGVHSDVYGLGAILYYLLTARPPFVGETMETTLAQVLEQEPVSPRLLNASVPRDLETICLKCLEKEPSRRYASAQAVADELGRFLEKKPILARPVGLAGKAGRWCRRKPALATALGAVVLVAAVGFVGILTQWRQAEQQRRNAESSELFARENAYAADMNLAQRALEANDVRLAVSLLNKHRPASSAPSTLNPQPSTDLRHWEWRYLWQLCQPDESVRLQSNSGSIGAPAISQDGRVMAVQTGGDKVVLWDLTTKRQMTELSSSGSIGILALSAAGDWLAVSTRNARGEPTVEVWDLQAGKIRSTLNLRSPVRSLAFSPNETLLASFDNKGTVAVVDWAANRAVTNLLVRLPRHGGAGVVVFSPDGSRLAIGEDYGMIRILNLGTNAPVTMTHLTQGGDGVTALAFSPNGGLLAAAFGFTTGTIRPYDASSGEPRGQTNHTGSVSALAFTGDGRRLASVGADRTIRVWRVANLAELSCLRGHEGEGGALAFLPDGKTLVSGCEVGTACFWDLTATNRPSCHASLPISRGPGSMVEVDPESLARDALNVKVVRRFGFTFTPDGWSFITTDTNGFLGVWDAKSVQQTKPLSELGSNNWGVALSPDGHWLAVGDASGKVHIWDWRERRAVTNFALPFEWFGHLRFSRSGRFLWALVTFNDRTTRCKIWRTENWQEVRFAGVQAPDIWLADLSSDDRFLATGCLNGTVKLWDFPSGQHETTFTNREASRCAAFFSPDGRMLVSTSWGGTVRLRDLFAHREVAAWRGHSGVWGAAFSPDGRRLATGGADAREAVKLWDLATQRELLSLPAEGQFFLHVAFSPDGSTLMATSFAGIAHLWRAPSWAEIEAAEKGGVSP